MKICESCQQKVVSFYLFQIKTRQAQESYKPPDQNYATIESELEEEQDEPLVLHTLDIVKNFIDKYSVQSIIEDENEQRLIIERNVSCGVIKQEAVEVKESYPEIYIDKHEAYEEEEDEIGYNFIEDSADEQPFELEDNSETLMPSPAERNREDLPKNDTESFILDNVEFVERTPEYLINAYKPAEKPSRPKDPDNWIRNKQRNARARGEAYRTTSGKTVAAKRMQSPCKQSCRYKCRTKISEEDRQQNFDKYWGLASFILQRKFIFEHHKTVPIQRRRFRSLTGGKPREYSSHYFLDKQLDDGGIAQVQVCESMFLRTFDICRNIVAYLHKKVQTGKVQDLRGINRRKLSPGHEEAIAQIKANPFFHIEQPMPITRMYDFYLEECAKKGIDPVRNHTYRKLFAEYNECEFLKREKVICGICDAYYRADEDEQKELFDKYNSHIQNHEKCMQRAKGRIRSARKAVKKRAMRQEKQAKNLQEDDEMIVEEHLSYDNEDMEYS